MSFKFAILMSQFNEEVSTGLRQGAVNYLKEHDIRVADEDFYLAPGAFEIPLLAQTLAETRRYAGIICLGCVIKGDTAHFEFISLGATLGMMQAMLATKTPMSFGILTTYTDDQAKVRSQASGEDTAHNKGREAAAACLATAKTLKILKSPPRD